MNLEARIKGLVESLLEAQDGYLVGLNVHPGRQVQVFVDRDPHITIDDCVHISRILEQELNKEFPFSEQYALEVSSPGLDQPLKVLRQYKKNVGKKVDVILFSGIKKSGMLMYADEEKILLEETFSSKHRTAETMQTEIPFVQIKSTSLVIIF